MKKKLNYLQNYYKICGCFLILTFSQGLFAGPSSKLSPVKLALNWKAEPQFGGFYYAKLEKVYSKNNLEVDIQEGGSGAPTLQMLINKKVDAAIVSAEEMILAKDRFPKDDLVALFATFQTNPHIIMTHAARGFQDLQDVLKNDGFLAIQSGLPYFQYLLKKHKQSPKVKIVPYAGGVSAFLNNPQYSQQGFLTSEPLLAEKAGAKIKSFLIAEALGFNPYTTILAVRKDWLENNLQQARVLVRATREGWQGYLRSPEATNQHMATLNKAMDLKTFQKSAEAQKILIQPSSKMILGTMQLKRWEELMQQMLESQQIKSVQNISNIFQNLE